MRRLLLIGMLAAFCLSGLWGCNTRSDEPVTVPQKFFGPKRVPPQPKDVKP